MLFLSKTDANFAFYPVYLISLLLDLDFLQKANVFSCLIQNIEYFLDAD